MVRQTALLTLCVGMTMNTYAQHLGSAHGVGMGAYTASTDDVHSLDWNPAGLSSVRDWETSLSNFGSFHPGFNGVVFGTAGIAKHFLAKHTVAMRYADGNAVEFVIPTLFVLTDSTSRLETAFDKKIFHRERFALGYAYRVGERLSVGASARYREETVSDTKYFTAQDSLTVVSSKVVDFDAKSWLGDLGALWNINRSWRVGLVAKNVIRLEESTLADEVQQFGLGKTRYVRGGVTFTPQRSFSLGLDVDTEGRGALGYEWDIWKSLWFRQGLYAKHDGSPFVQALSVGIGWSTSLFEADVGYLRFMNQRNRTGIGTLSDFTPLGWESAEWNPFTHDRAVLSLKVNLGRSWQQLAKIEYVEMLTDVFPASYQTYAYRPLGKVHVRNVSDKPIEAKVRFFIRQVMDQPTESKPYYIRPHETAQVPITAIFSSAIRDVTEMVIREADVFVTATPATEYDDRSQTRVLIHGRNDWNGDVLLLRYFVTPEDPALMKFTRQTLDRYRDSLATVPGPLQNFAKAAILFDEFAGRISYVSDPKKSTDRVQYSSETLDLRGGDCDDMTVCFSSMLISVGVGVAYVDVIPPDRGGEAHIYLLFDTGISPDRAPLISENPKRYVIRKNEQGKETVWIPVETTETIKGFDAAWNLGAKEFFDETELNSGLVDGWVQVVDVQTIF